MSMMTRVILVIAAVGLVIGLELYARKGRDLTANGKKLICLFYVIAAAVLTAAAIIG